jgi:flagellar motor switch protein FliM
MSESCNSEKAVELISGLEHRVKLYDFRRPDKFSKDQISTIAHIHMMVARLTTVSLSARLRERSEVSLRSVDQMTYREFISELPDPSVFAVIQMDPLIGAILIEYSPEITGPLINKMYGGAGEKEPLNRSVTGLEILAMEEINQALLGNLREAWSQVIDLRPRLSCIEVNPMFVQILPPTEMVVTVTLELDISGQKGLIRMGIPYLTIEPIMEHLSAKYWFESIVSNRGPKHDAMVEMSRKLPIALRMAVRTKIIPLLQLFEYKVGDTITLMSDAKDASVSIYNGEEVLISAMVEDVAAEQIAFHFEDPENQDDEKGAVLEEVRKLREEISQKADKKTQSSEEPVKEIPRLASVEKPGGIMDLSTLELPGDLEPLVKDLVQEEDQTLAWVLAQMSSTNAAVLLSQLSPERQTGIALKIAELEHFDSKLLTGVFWFLKRTLGSFDSSKMLQGSAFQRLRSILQVGPRTLEKSVIDGILEVEPQLGKAIIDRMFVFEDLLTLDSVSLQKGLAGVDVKDLCISLKASGDELRNGFLDALSEDRRLELQTCLSSQGPLRVSEIEAAQNKVIAHFQKLDLQGEIIIPRADELVE